MSSMTSMPVSWEAQPVLLGAPEPDRVVFIFGGQFGTGKGSVSIALVYKKASIIGAHKFVM